MLKLGKTKKVLEGLMDAGNDYRLIPDKIFLKMPNKMVEREFWHLGGDSYDGVIQRFLGLVD